MRDFTKETGGRELFSFLMPILMVKFFEILSGTLTPVIVNRFLSEEAITCISACRVYPALQGNLIGVTAAGFGVFVTRYVGKGLAEGQQRAVKTALTGAGVLALIGLGFMELPGFLLQAVCVPSGLSEMAGRYLFWLFAGSLPLVYQSLFLSIFYGLGESAFAGRVSMAGVVLQPVLTCLFILFFGMGVEAVPIASFVNRLLMAMFLSGHLMRRYRYLFQKTGFSLENVRELWNCGLSQGIMLTIIWIGTFLIQKEVNQMPQTHISAYMYAVVAEDFLLFPIYGCREAASAILAQCAGAGDVFLVRKYFYRFNRICLAVCVLVAGIIWFFGSAYVGLLLGFSGEEVTRLTVRWLRICAFAFPALSLCELSRALLQAVGAYGYMEFLGVLNGLLRAALGMTVIAGAGFDALIGSFFCIFLLTGAGGGIGCCFALRRFEEERKNGEQVHINCG